MTNVIITIKLMPESPDVDFAKIREQAESKITAFDAKVGKVEEEPLAFGLKSLNIIFVMDEAKGSTDSLEEDLATIEGVTTVEVTDVRRAIG